MAYQHFRRAARKQRIMNILAWAGGIVAFLIFIYVALGLVTGGPRNPNAPPPTRSRR